MNDTYQPQRNIGALGVQPTRYCLYARKSTEQDERQALSIDSQIKEMVQMAMRDGITVTEIRQESHSAKDSGLRPVFNELLRDVGQGKFDGIIAWDPSRISRNAGDLGRVVDLMDAGVLKEIRTHGQRFTNSPNEKFLLMILCSQAKLENDHKGENVKRGLRTKCEMGWRPGAPPLGYVHDPTAKKGERRIYVDPVRAPIVKQVFEKVAYHGYSGRDLFTWLNEEVHFKTRNNKNMTLSVIYNMLRQHFYYGRFEYPEGSGIFYDGKHDPIITKDLFDKVQSELVVIPRLRAGIKEFNFTRLFKCGACGSGICVQEKFKKLSNGSVTRYVYYHCSKFKDKYCGQPYIREEELVGQLLELIDKISIDTIGAKEKLEREIARHRQFVGNVLGQEYQNETNLDEVNVKNYAKYLLKEGTREEKRELLCNIKNHIYIKDGNIILKK